MVAGSPHYLLRDFILHIKVRFLPFFEVLLSARLFAQRQQTNCAILNHQSSVEVELNLLDIVMVSWNTFLGDEESGPKSVLGIKESYLKG